MWSAQASILNSAGLEALLVVPVPEDCRGLIFIRGGGLFSEVWESCVKGFSAGVAETGGVAFAGVGAGDCAGDVCAGVDGADAAGEGEARPLPEEPPSFASRFARICRR